MTDTIEALRPDLQLFSSAQEAYEAAMELEKKFRDKMGERERSLCVCVCVCLLRDEEGREVLGMKLCR